MRTKLFVLVFGLLTHVIFLLAIFMMAKELYGGMTSQPWITLPVPGLLLNTLLVLQFPFLHSWFLSNKGRNQLSKLFSGTLGKDLLTTSYALFASLQILTTFSLWQPSGRILWIAAESSFQIMSISFALGWLLLGKSMIDAGLSIQTGSLGWTSIVRGKRPNYPKDFPKQGLFKLCRQPIYLSFALILWTGPLFTLDRVVIGLIWGVYCFVGPLLKEARFLTRWGESFKEYQMRVPYLIPTGKKVRKWNMSSQLLVK